MTVGGWPLTGKVHIGDDYSLAYWSCFAGMSAAWNVIWALNTEWSFPAGLPSDDQAATCRSGREVGAEGELELVGGQRISPLLVSGVCTVPAGSQAKKWQIVSAG